MALSISTAKILNTDVQLHHHDVHNLLTYSASWTQNEIGLKSVEAFVEAGVRIVLDIPLSFLFHDDFCFFLNSVCFN